MMWYYILLLHFISQVFCNDNLSRVVIIGAGSSGIAAASRLFEHGFKNITILEAENRIGGRVYTIRFDDNWVDLGGQWVHGEKNNVAFELAWPLGLLGRSTVSGISNLAVHDSKGVHIANNISQNLINVFYKISEEGDKNLLRNNGSIGTYFEEALMSYFEKHPVISKSLRKKFIKLFELFQNSVDASDTWHEVSAKGFLEYWECPGDSMINWKDRGYSTILDILMKKYPNPDKELPVINNTVLSAEVTAINYTYDKNQILIRTLDGNLYTADHVIVTPSLGVLQNQYETLFTPALPEWKVKTIKGLSFGTVGKIYLSFDKPWWPNNISGFAFIWDDVDRKNIENNPNEKWLLGLFGLFPVEHKPRLLCGWLSGPGAREMEKISEVQVLNQTMNYLHKFLGKSYNITVPTRMLRSQWYSNKHFRGTYSYRSLESERANVWADQLAEPLTKNKKPIVLFAGEATNTHYYSTVHGAIASGWREADRLITLYSKHQ